MKSQSAICAAILSTFFGLAPLQAQEGQPKGVETWTGTLRGESGPEFPAVFKLMMIGDALAAIEVEARDAPVTSFQISVAQTGEREGAGTVKPCDGEQKGKVCPCTMRPDPDNSNGALIDCKDIDSQELHLHIKTEQTSQQN